MSLPCELLFPFFRFEADQHFILRDGDLTLALNTRYVFADVPEELDLRDIDGIRKWFIASLAGMGNLLDMITESPALTGTTE